MANPFKEIPVRFGPFIFKVFVVATATLAIVSASAGRTQTNWIRDVGHGHTSAGTAGGGNWDTSTANTVWLDQLDISSAAQDWGEPHKNQSVGGNPLTIGGKIFERGFGTHAESDLRINVGGDAQSFSASVGVDDEVNSPTASVEFIVIGDGQELWHSGVMRASDTPKECVVSLSGVKALTLKVGHADDGNSYDHADWADEKFETTKAKIFVVNGEEIPVPVAPYILTPPAPVTPRFNGADVFGVRPGLPFLVTIPATGELKATAQKD
jgi:alpha-galactosidase